MVHGSCDAGMFMFGSLWVVFVSFAFLVLFVVGSVLSAVFVLLLLVLLDVFSNSFARRMEAPKIS